MIKDQEMKTKRLCVIVMFVIMLIQCLAMAFYWYRESQNQKRLKNELVRSTLQGAPESTLVINGQAPSISQTFVNQHEQLNQFVVFFYHCDETESGQVYTRLKDSEGNIYYEYMFEPLYMDINTFCLTADLDLEKGLAVNEEYSIEISVDNMADDDYIEVGTTMEASKPAVFKELLEGSTLFTVLDYTFVDMRAVENHLKTVAKGCLAIDGFIALAYLWIVGKRRKLVFTVLGMSAFVLLIGMVSKNYIESNKWFRKNSYVVHAMGEIDGREYSNSREAFEMSYQGGHRIFEVDFAMTSDNKIVLKHDWTNSHGLPEFEDGTPPTLAEFKEAKIWGKYTTLDIDDLLQLMLEYPDIYIVTDSKSGVYKEVVEQFTQITEILQGYSSNQRNSIMERFVVQIYNDDMYTGVETVAHFENYIYTLYQRGVGNLDQLGEFCVENEIPVVVLPYEWWNEEITETLHSYGLEVWVHTLNENEDIAELRDKGVDGVYTDATNVSELVLFSPENQ